MKLFFLCISVLYFSVSIAQSHETVELMMEKYLENTETNADYSQIQEELGSYLRTPVYLNTATAEELMRFPLLSPAGALAIIHHRNTFGPFLHLSELQVIGFSAEDIRRLSPYVSVDKSAVQQLQDLKTSVKHGDLLWVNSFRYRPDAEIPAGALGDPLMHSMRFRYSIPGKYSAGFTTDKDPGELWWRHGPDFFSAHIFIQNFGKIKSLALGDYLLGFGQGLVMGSGIGMGKSALVLNTKRNVSELKPSRGVNEFLFLRGAAMTVQVRKLELTIAAARNGINSRLLSDTLNQATGFSSQDADGWHRTPAEIAERHNNRRDMAGGWLKYNGLKGHWGAGISAMRFLISQTPSENLYQMHLPEGRSLGYFQIFQAHTVNRFHIFSEWAYLAQNRSRAANAGILTALGKHAEISILWRHYEPGFYSPFSTAFGNRNSNEHGLYAGLKIRLTHRFSLSHYTDIWTNPWLSYRTWSPSRGTDMLWQADYTPPGKSAFYFRIRNQNKPFPENDAEKVKLVERQTITQFRLHFTGTVSHKTSIQMRGESAISVIQGITHRSSLAFIQINTHIHRSIRIAARYTLFEVPFYYNRLYAFETQLPYEFGTAAFYGSGYSAWAILQVRIHRHLTLGLRASHTERKLPDEENHSRQNTFNLQISFK